MNNIEIINQIIKKNKNKYLKWLFVSIVSNLMLLISGLLLSSIFDCYEEYGENSVSTYKIYRFILLFLVSLIVRIFFVYKNSIISAECRFIVCNCMRGNFLQNMLQKPGAEKSEKSNGEIINSFIEDSKEAQEYVEAILNFITFTLFGGVAVIILIIIDWKLLVMSFAPVIVIILMTRKASKLVAKFRYENRRLSGKVSKEIGDIFNNILTIKLFGVESNVIAHFKDLNKERRKISLKDALLRKIILIFSSNAVGFGTGVVMLGMVFTYNSSYVLNKFVLFTYYISFISMSIEYLSDIFVEKKRMQIAFDNISNISPYIDIKTFSNTDIIEGNIYNSSKVCKKDLLKIKVNDLSYKYAGAFTLSDINFEIMRGSVTVICGKNGSGKTTLIRALLGLVDSKGDVCWNDKKNENLKEYCNTSQISYSPQNPHFFNKSIEENITNGKEYDPNRVKTVISKVGLDKDLEIMADRKYENIGSDGEKLSGGQRKRLSLARMLYTDAELFVIDDISSSIDITTVNIILNSILVNKEKTFIITSNKKEELKYADQIIFMNEGRIEKIGTYSQLLQVCDKFRDLLMFNELNGGELNE